MEKDLYTTIREYYPELTSEDFVPELGIIHLRDEGDGIPYIYKWNYSKPIPEGLTLGKPGGN